MKYSILLILIPFLSVGQVNNLKELKKIKSQETFEQVLIENGYELSRDDNSEYIEGSIVFYELNAEYDSENGELEKIDGSAFYDNVNNEWSIMYIDEFPYKYNESYNKVYDIVKKSCNFHKVYKRGTTAFSTYDCLPNGYLGFGRASGANWIMFFPNLDY